jgi:EmrB/QacA subfamily drug resistance transporter
VRQRLLTSENRKWWTLAAVSLALFMIMLDNTVVNVALPSIQRDLGAQLSELEWVVSGYALTFASLLLTGGKLGDLLGRRRMLVIGLVIFGGSSLACALAPDAGVLIGARIVQGVGAALMSPATLSIIAATFGPRQRGTAIGIWVGVSATALAIGPLVGGLLTEHVGWSSIFYINVPIGAVAVVASFLLIDESKDASREQRLDLPGLVTSGVGLFALTYGLIEANTYGWTSGRIVGAFAIAAVSLAAFILLELHQRLPMLDLSLFRSSTFTGANTVVLLVALAMFGIFFFVSLYMQNILGYSAVQAGAAFLPLTLLVVLMAPVAGRLSDRLGSRSLMTFGMTLVGLQLLYFSTLGVNESYWALVPGMLLGGIGMPAVMTPASAAAMSGVSADKAGVGSAVLNSSRQVGGSLGIALMGAIMAHEIKGSRAAEPFVHGFSRGLLVAAGIAFAGAIVAVTTVRSHASPSPARAAEPHVSRLRRLRRVADEGQSPTTPAILGGAVLLALIPVLLTALAVASVASHFAV